MNDETTAECPRLEDISALMDGVLTGRAADEVRAHAVHCPLCAAALRDFSAISMRLQPLRDIRSDVDLAALVGPRLPPRRPARPRKPARSWGGWWQLAPGGLAAAASIGAGAWLGLMLVTGGGTALRPASMAVFDAAPPGALCSGLPLCSPRGR
jgi:anti-sigma factor RsiW